MVHERTAAPRWSTMSENGWRHLFVSREKELAWAESGSAESGRVRVRPSRGRVGVKLCYLFFLRPCIQINY